MQKSLLSGFRVKDHPQFSVDQQGTAQERRGAVEKRGLAPTSSG